MAAAWVAWHNVNLMPSLQEISDAHRQCPEGRHYSGVGGAGAVAVILGGGWVGSSSFSFSSKRLSSSWRLPASPRSSRGREKASLCRISHFSS